MQERFERTNKKCLSALALFIPLPRGRVLKDSSLEESNKKKKEKRREGKNEFTFGNSTFLNQSIDA